MPNSKKALTLSLIIPAYNEEDYLRGCLDSVAAQTIQPDEVIVVDNNSTDRTKDVASEFPFVTLLSEKKVGVTFARDRGYNNAKSDLIGRIDSDTRLPDDWVSNIKEMFINNPDTAAVSGPTAFYDIPFRKTSLMLNKIIRTALYYLGAKEERYLFGSNMALRKSAWLAVADKTCHDYGIHEDNDLAIHLVQSDFHVHYSNNLTADISVRRADSSLKDAVKYAAMEYSTFRKHNIFSPSAALACITLLFYYPLLRFLRRIYNPKTNKISLRRLFSYSPRSRKLPMD